MKSQGQAKTAIGARGGEQPQAESPGDVDDYICGAAEFEEGAGIGVGGFCDGAWSGEGGRGVQVEDCAGWGCVSGELGRRRRSGYV
jgi:hypothetical protein